MPYTPLLFKSRMLFMFGWKSETIVQASNEVLSVEFCIDHIFTLPWCWVSNIYLSALKSQLYLSPYILVKISDVKTWDLKISPKTLVFLVDFSVTLFVLDIPVFDWKSIWIGCVKCTPKKKVISPSWYDSPFSCWMNVMSFSVSKSLLHMLLHIFRRKF